VTPQLESGDPIGESRARCVIDDSGIGAETRLW
jgi:hypothetical protein